MNVMKKRDVGTIRYDSVSLTLQLTEKVEISDRQANERQIVTYPKLIN